MEKDNLDTMSGHIANLLSSWWLFLTVVFRLNIRCSLQRMRSAFNHICHVQEVMVLRQRQLWGCFMDILWKLQYDCCEELELKSGSNLVSGSCRSRDVWSVVGTALPQTLSNQARRRMSLKKTNFLHKLYQKSICDSDGCCLYPGFIRQFIL